MAKIGVENSLGDVKEMLQNNGHEVAALDERNVDQFECCVISGQDKNMMGMTETVTKAPVINAQGLTSEQVLQRVQQSLQH
jgi:hypothetical protein